MVNNDDFLRLTFLQFYFNTDLYTYHAYENVMLRAVCQPKIIKEQIYDY